METTYAKASSTMRKTPVQMKDVKESLLNIWPNDDEFKSSFKEKTLTTPRIIKYLLAKLETSTISDQSLVLNTESLSVEHILPKQPDSGWPSRMRTDEYLKEHLNKIGNLTILTEPMNRECESRNFTFKKTLYQNSKFKITQNLASLVDWTETEIDERQAKMADIAAKTWVL